MRLKLKGFIVVAFLFTGTYLFGQTGAAGNAGLSRGESLFKENNAKDAVQVLEYEILNGQISDNSFNFLGLGYYQLGEYEKSIVVLSDYCHLYSEDELYSFALFYIGESLFAGYKYDEAGSVYERIVTEFPESAKTPAAQYRLETILQRGREEKLLYLLKQTGEEYLAAKEEYERQLRLYNSEAVDSTRQKLTAAQARNESLEKQVNELELEIEALKNNQAESERIIQQLKEAGERDIPEPEPFDEKKYQLKLLKAKALEAQRMLDEKLGTSSTEGK